MTRVSTMVEAEALLAEFVPLSASVTGKDITVDRTLDLLQALGNPHKRLRIIHVAGTSGKTSTCYFVAGLLASTGRKIGLSVSPHIDTVRERVQINMQPLSETEFVSLLNEYMQIVEGSGIEPTYFELLVAFAYWCFDRQGVDYAVIETGMGGMHDSTNVARQQDKVCAITDIGMDHMHVLGSSVPEIARQKAGIIHDGNETFVQNQPEEIIDEINARAEAKNASVHIVTSSNETVDSLPVFQRRNWVLAKAVFDYVRERDGLPEANLETAIEVQVPGRMDEVVVAGKTIIMDGAHNEQKTKALVGSLQAKFPGHKMPVLLALKRGKEFAAVLPLLKPITSKLIVTCFQHSQDLPIPAIDTHELATAAKKFGYEQVVEEPDKENAYNMLTNEPGDKALITGSLYLIGQLRNSHKELIK